MANILSETADDCWAVWFADAITPDFKGTRQECERFVSDARNVSSGYHSFLVVKPHSS